MTNLEALLVSKARAAALLVLLVVPAAVAWSQNVDNAAAYALANQVADELELVRERMGAAYDDSPRLPVSAVTELELYYQTESLLDKANQLAQELASAAPRTASAVPPGDIDADDVYALLEGALAQIRVAAEAVGITERATFERRVTSIAPTGVFLVVIDVNRQLNHMLRVPVADVDVFEEVSAAIESAAALLATYPGATPLPDAPPFDGYKRPADVYQRLTECIDAVIRIAPKIGVPVLGLSPRRNVSDDTDAGDAYDIARFLVADLAAFAAARKAPSTGNTLPTPRHIFATEAYARAGVLLRQLEELERRL
jgi:hypothetical protein